jgi:hypothetical protein
MRYDDRGGLNLVQRVRREQMLRLAAGGLARRRVGASGNEIPEASDKSF